MRDLSNQVYDRTLMILVNNVVVVFFGIRSTYILYSYMAHNHLILVELCNLGFRVIGMMNEKVNDVPKLSTIY